MVRSSFLFRLAACLLFFAPALNAQSQAPQASTAARNAARSQASQSQQPAPTARSAAAPQKTADLSGHYYQTTKVTDGVYSFIAKEPKAGVVQGNVTLIAGEDGALVVDSGQFPGLARKMIAEIKRLTPQPVRTLVNTHWHGDHLLANHIFKQAFPGLQVVAHAETRRIGEKAYGDWEEQKAGFPKMIELMRLRISTGKKRDGSPMSEADIFSYRTDSDALDNVLPDLADAKYTPPDITFRDEVVFYLGKREVRVSKLGLGNTAGDAVIWVPDAKVLITGDTVVYPTPYSFGSYHSEWIEVLKKMMAMGATRIVPGHGPVMEDASYLQTLVELLGETREQVRAAVQQGLTLEETQKKVDLSKFRTRLAGADPYRLRAFREFYEQPGIPQAYKEAKGEPRTEPQ